MNEIREIAKATPIKNINIMFQDQKDIHYNITDSVDNYVCEDFKTMLYDTIPQSRFAYLDILRLVNADVN